VRNSCAVTTQLRANHVDLSASFWWYMRLMTVDSGQALTSSASVLSDRLVSILHDDVLLGTVECRYVYRL